MKYGPVWDLIEFISLLPNWIGCSLEIIRVKKWIGRKGIMLVVIICVVEQVAHKRPSDFWLDGIKVWK